MTPLPGKTLHESGNIYEPTTFGLRFTNDDFRVKPFEPNQLN